MQFSAVQQFNVVHLRTLHIPSNQFVKAVEDLASIRDHLPLFRIGLLSVAQEFLRAFKEKLPAVKRIIPTYLDNVDYKGTISRGDYWAES